MRIPTRIGPIVLTAILVLLAGCKKEDPAQKIGFDLKILNEDGLYGPPDGLRSLQYEFCIPAGSNVLNEVTSIDPSLQCGPGKGRVKCTLEEVLCLGDTHQSNHKQILLELADLSYVRRIEQSYFE